MMQRLSTSAFSACLILFFVPCGFFQGNGVIAKSAVYDSSVRWGSELGEYSMARKYPELFKRLFCYCGCDVLANKKTLFDSFTDDYAMDEPISRQEAALAYKLYEEGKSLAEIQQAIDDKFSADYPYTEPSKALLRYRKSRSRSAMKPLKSHGSYNVVKTNSNCQ